MIFTSFFVMRPIYSMFQFYQIFCLVNRVWFRCVLQTTRVETLSMVLCVSHACTPPEFEIIQVKHKYHSRCHVLNYCKTRPYIARPGTLLNNESIQGLAYLSRSQH